MMERHDDACEDRSLRYSALVYWAVMIAALFVGLFGLVSLISLAGTEVQRATAILPY